MARIYMIMGKSSSGKDTIYSRLKEDVRLGLKPVVIYTTRPRRIGEENGREYFFSDDVQLQKYEEQGRIVEMRSYNTVQGVWKYFTVDDGQIDIQSNEKYVIIGTLDVYEKFRDYYGKEAVVPIYIEVEDKIRIHRALEREDRQPAPDYKEMCRRYVADEADFSESRLESLGIVKRYRNESLEQCVEEIAGEILR
ncbi:MAG: guanylate kinase [Butyrivibrio sp.]